MNLAGTPQIQFAEQQDDLLVEVQQMMSHLLMATLPQDALGEICRYHLETGGRRLRARLALACTEALGGCARDALGWATACELLHNATLIHDDLQDGDHTRRGRQTVWSKFGVRQAINAGDLMLMTPLLALNQSRCSSDTKWRLSLLLTEAAVGVVRGQADELELPRYLASPELRARYTRVVQDKTSALFTLPVQGSALLAGWSLDQIETLTALVSRVGVVFQICDDLLDILGRKGRNQPGEDLREGKVSSVIVCFLSERAIQFEKREQLIEFLRQPRDQVTVEQVREWLHEFHVHGVPAATINWAHELAGEIFLGLRSLGENRLSRLLNQLLAGVMAQLD